MTSIAGGPDGMELIYGAGRLDRRVPEVDALLRDWRVKEADWGQLYLEFEPCTPKDRVLVEDLAATMLINSRVAAQAATSVYRYASALDLGALPSKALEETTEEERQAVAEVIGTMTSWALAFEGFLMKSAGALSEAFQLCGARLNEIAPPSFVPPRRRERHRVRRGCDSGRARRTELGRRVSARALENDHRAQRLSLRLAAIRTVGRLAVGVQARRQ